MTDQQPRPLGFGEALPALAVRTTARSISLPALAGADRVVVFVSALGDPGACGLLRLVRAILAEHPAADLLFVSGDPAEAPAAALREDGIDGRIILDGDGRLAAACGVVPPTGEAAVAFRLDRALRVVDREAVDRLDQLRELLAGWRAGRPAPREPRRLGTHPPVLLLDKVFEPRFAAALIRWHEASGGQESGFMVRDQDGERTVGRVDRRVKRRRDAFVTDQILVDQCRKRLLLRLGPALELAFQFKATRIERYLVARYDASDRGMFRPHRDNDTTGTAHRRFAVSINLNDDYEGGCLRFPEFGDDLYRPDPGSALAFSCSLLHEATPVTAGTRYTFLTFLFGEEDAATLERNRRLVVDEGRGALVSR